MSAPDSFSSYRKTSSDTVQISKEQSINAQVLLSILLLCLAELSRFVAFFIDYNNELLLNISNKENRNNTAIQYPFKCCLLFTAFHLRTTALQHSSSPPYELKIILMLHWIYYSEDYSAWYLLQGHCQILKPMSCNTMLHFCQCIAFVK